MSLDGYVVAPAGTEVELGNGVRHIAHLDNGEVFVAFEGEIPCGGRLLLNDPDQDGFWWKVRRVAPTSKVRRYGPAFSDEPETFVQVTANHFRQIDPLCIRMASVLTDGTVLLVTTPDAIPAVSALWTASAEWFLDERLATV
jgi:hypothetical protein